MQRWKRMACSIHKFAVFQTNFFDHRFYRVFNLKEDRQLSREYFTSDAIYNVSAGMTL